MLCFVGGFFVCLFLKEKIDVFSSSHLKKFMLENSELDRENVAFPSFWNSLCFVFCTSAHNASEDA